MPFLYFTCKSIKKDSYLQANTNIFRKKNDDDSKFFTYRSSLFTFFRTFAAAMENSIRHEGIVESIEGEHIRVRIIQHSACSVCKVASHCTASESKEKVVDVYNSRHTDLHIGDAVTISTSVHSAGKALLLGFGIPLILVLATIAILLATGLDEGLTAIIALGTLVPYYLILWILRNHIAKTITFTIE